MYNSLLWPPDHLQFDWTRGSVSVMMLSYSYIAPFHYCSKLLITPTVGLAHSLQNTAKKMDSFLDTTGQRRIKRRKGAWLFLWKCLSPLPWQQLTRQTREESCKHKWSKQKTTKLFSSFRFKSFRMKLSCQPFTCEMIFSQGSVYTTTFLGENPKL